MALFSYDNMIHKKKKSIFWKTEKVWLPTTLQSLEVHGQVIPFWKPPISHCLEPGVHRNSMAIMAQNPHSKLTNLQGKLAKSRVLLQGTVRIFYMIFNILSLSFRPYVNYKSQQKVHYGLRRNVCFVSWDWNDGWLTW